MTSARVHVYSRPGCHLCEVLVDALLPLIRGRAEVEVRNIEICKDWRIQYGDRIPVVEVDGRFVCQYHLDVPALQQALTRDTATMTSS